MTQANNEGDPFGKLDKKLWLDQLRKGSKWQFYIEQFRLATRQSNLGAA
jgi:hypothetical protein